VLFINNRPVVNFRPFSFKSRNGGIPSWIQINSSECLRYVYFPMILLFFYLFKLVNEKIAIPHELNLRTRHVFIFTVMWNSHAQTGNIILLGIRFFNTCAWLYVFYWGIGMNYDRKRAKRNCKNNYMTTDWLFITDWEIK